MAQTLYMDVNVPTAITEGLRRQGIDVLTSQEDGTREEDDATLLSRATDLERVLFTHDIDFLSIAAECQQSGRSLCGVIYAHQQRISIGPLIQDLELLLTCCGADELENRVTYLPLS